MNDKEVPMYWYTWVLRFRPWATNIQSQQPTAGLINIVSMNHQKDLGQLIKIN